MAGRPHRPGRNAMAVRASGTVHAADDLVPGVVRTALAREAGIGMTTDELPGRARGVVAMAGSLLAAYVPRGALLLSVLTVGSYLVGLLRDRVLARTFGAGSELDVYNAALIIPELTLDVLVYAGLSAAFVPVFTRARREGDAVGHEFGRTVLTTAMLLMGIADVVLFVIAPATVALVAPGFDAAQRELYVQLFRVMCVTAFIFSASFSLGEMLVARQRFLGYGLAPILYNAGIVFGAIVLAPRMGIYGVAVGTVLGALLHLGVRSLDMLRTDFRFRPRLAIRSVAFREYVRLSIPKALSQPIEPLTFAYFTAIASTLAAGSVSSVSFARNFQSMPVSLIGIAFSVAAFPLLSAAAAAGERARFRRLAGRNIVVTTLLAVAAAMVLYLLSGLVIRTFLAGGAFDAEDVAHTTILVGVFALSVPLETLTQVLGRAIYATDETLLPSLASVLGLLVIVASVVVLTPTLGIVALPLGFAAGTGAKAIMLGVVLVARIRRMPKGPELDDA